MGEQGDARHILQASLENRTAFFAAAVVDQQDGDVAGRPQRRHEFWQGIAGVERGNDDGERFIHGVFNDANESQGMERKRVS